jgi:hypothetical protein
VTAFVAVLRVEIISVVVALWVMVILVGMGMVVVMPDMTCPGNGPHGGSSNGDDLCGGPLQVAMVFVRPYMALVPVVLLLVLPVEIVFMTPGMALPAEVLFILAAVLMTAEVILPVEILLVMVVLMVVLQVGMLLPMETVLVLVALVVAFRVVLCMV